MTVLIIKKDFVTGGNYFRRGEYYLFRDTDRNRAGWLTITNRKYEFETQVPKDLVIKADAQNLKKLSEEGLITLRLIDRTDGMLRKEGSVK